MSNGYVETKPLGAVLTEIKDDLKEFAQTRFEMLRQELGDKLKVWKAAIPMLAIALVFGWTGFLCLTFFLVAAIRTAFPGDWSWAIASIIVAVLYFIVAGSIGWIMYRELSYTGMKPERTMEVLKQDQVWLQNEARQQS
jgi:uncharacterized membrane protein YqjE